MTILLVTHVMEEAESLCDRLAVIDSGRVIAVDTPAGMIAGLEEEAQRIRFRPSAPLDRAVLTALPEVSSARQSGNQLEVAGTADALLAVVTELAEHRITPVDLRLEQSSLEDAFVALTGRPFDA